MYLQKTVPAFAKGGLFLIATPIGNLEDITLRAINTLKNVDYILVEDTRVSQKLLQHLEISKKLISFHEHNQYDKTPIIMQDIREGKSVGLISDAGMPCISDPGAILVKAMIQAELPITVVPGPSAGVALFSLSGLSDQGHFLFHGFLPTKEKAKVDVLKGYLDLDIPLVFYESPQRILKTLKTLVTIYPTRTRIALGRELTKLHETLLWFTLAEFNSVIFRELMTWKGEITFIVFNEVLNRIELDDKTLLELIGTAIDEGLKPKEAMKQVGAKTGQKPNALYQLWQKKGKTK